MSEYKVALFDIDGVLIKTPKFFSHHYAEKHGYNKADFDNFFANYFGPTLKNKADLKELVRQHRNVWRWKNDPQEILDAWFEFESNVNTELLSLIEKLRKKGVKVYLTSDQEKYRAKYMREVLFADKFDGSFFASDFGLVKEEPGFFDQVLDKLRKELPDIEPSEVIYFDDGQNNIDAAKLVGITAHLYTTNENARQLLG